MSSPLPFTILILAAGKGTRMKSNKAKVLHEVFYKPMILHVLQAILPLQPSRTLVIVGHQQTAVRQALADFPVDFISQDNQLGTGHAVLAAEQAISTGTAETVMIVCGDTPLIRTATLRDMHTAHCASSAALTFMTTLLENPTNYGRILIDPEGSVLGIVEEKDATPEQKAIQEINAGIYCVSRTFLFEALHQVGTDNSQGELYLTDIVSLAVAARQRVERFMTPASRDVLGVNSRVELAAAHQEIQVRRNLELMLQGVSMHAPETTSVSAETIVGRDSLLMAGVQIHGASRLGEGCRLEPGVILHNCLLGDNVEVGAYSYLKDCSIPSATVMPPYSRQALTETT